MSEKEEVYDVDEYGSAIKAMSNNGYKANNLDDTESVI